jgi:hypothetical protein
VFVFLRNSVKYAQSTVEEALRRVKLMRANLRGTEILTALQHIYKQPSVPGHPLQVRVGTEIKKGMEWNPCSRIHSSGLHHRIVEKW